MSDCKVLGKGEMGSELYVCCISTDWVENNKGYEARKEEKKTLPIMGDGDLIGESPISWKGELGGDGLDIGISSGGDKTLN